MGGHGGLDHFKGLAERGNLEHVEAGAEQQIGELDGLLLQLLRLRGRDGRDSGGHDLADVARKGALTKGRGCFFAGFGELDSDYC